MSPDAWYSNPLSVALLAAFVGSIIVVVGQFAAAYLPIITSDTASDFTIGVETIYYDIFKDKATNSLQWYMEEHKISSAQGIGNGSIPMKSLLVTGKLVTVNDLHRILKPYQHSVFVSVSGEVPKGMKITFYRQEGKPPFFSLMDINFTNEMERGDYPITIQGLGGDGKVRSCKIIVHVGYDRKDVFKGSQSTSS